MAVVVVIAALRILFILRTLLLLSLLLSNIFLQVNFFRKYILLSIKDLRLQEKAKNRN